MSIDVTPTQADRTLSDRVAEEVRVAMVRRRVTGAKLAKELGVSAAWVSYRLTGVQPIDLNDLQRIANVLGVTVHSLIPGALGDTKPSHTPHPYAPVRILRNTAPNDGRPAGRSHASTRPNGQRRTSRVA